MRPGERALRIVHTEASRGWGGQEIRILTEAQGMYQRGHTAQIWATPDSPILTEAARRGLPHRALAIGKKNLRGVRALRRALIEVQPDVVNTHSSIDAWLVAFASLTLSAPPPMVRTRHISPPVSRDPATRWLYARATRHIVTTGEALRRELIERNRLSGARITSVPTGIDLDVFAPGDKAAARVRLGLKPGAFIIGIVATLRSWKGHKYLIDAFARFRDSDSRLLIVGDGPMRADIERQVRSLGLGERAVLAGNQREVLPWLQALDVFALPSYANEGVPQALMQAMACALPVVTTDVGGIGEAVQHEHTGLIVPARDRDALHAALARLRADPGLCAALAADAARVARERFGADKMIERMERVFQHVCRP